MRKAVIFDLYETLITENHPEWHVEVPTAGKRLGRVRLNYYLPLYYQILHLLFVNAPLIWNRFRIKASHIIC